MVKIDLREIHDSLNLPDGRRVVIVNWSGKSDVDAARNLYLTGKDGHVVWRVSSKFDSEGAPFTKIVSHSNGKLVAYRWDGGDYEIDMESGFASPSAFRK